MCVCVSHSLHQSLIFQVAIIAGNFELAEYIKNHKETDIGKYNIIQFDNFNSVLCENEVLLEVFASEGLFCPSPPLGSKQAPPFCITHCSGLGGPLLLLSNYSKAFQL